MSILLIHVFTQKKLMLWKNVALRYISRPTIHTAIQIIPKTRRRILKKSFKLSSNMCTHLYTIKCFITKQIKKIKATCEELQNFLQKYQVPLEMSLNIIKAVNKENHFSVKTEVKKNLSSKKTLKKKFGLFQLHSPHHKFSEESVISVNTASSP